MKGLIKGCLITGGICIVIGFIVVVAGVTSVGADAVRKYVRDGEFTVSLYNEGWHGWNHWDWEDEDWDDEDWAEELEEAAWRDEPYAWNDGEAARTPGPDETPSGQGSVDMAQLPGPSADGEMIESVSGIRSLDVDFRGGALYLVEDAAIDEIQVFANSHKISFDCYRDGDTLKFEDKGSHRIGDYNEREVILHIPAGVAFDSVELELGGGLLSADSIQADKVEIDAGAGEVQVRWLKAEQADFDIGAGEMIIRNAQVTNASIEVGVGHAFYQGAITGGLKAECGMGQLEMQLAGSSKDHNYDIESGAGEVKIGGHGYGAGVALEKKIDNGAPDNYKLNCGMGSIVLSFDEES